MKFILFRNFFALSLLLAHASVFSQHFMYQPGCASGKAYLHEDHNLSVKTYMNGGTSKKAYNSTGSKVELLNLYGNEQGAYAFHGVDLSPLTGNLLLLAQTLQTKDLTNKSALYGATQVAGKITMFSAGMTFTRKVTEHFAMHVSLPVHHFSLKNVAINSLTPTAEMDGDFLAGRANLEALLAAYKLHVRDVRDTTIGDIQMFMSVHFTREEDDTFGESSLSASVGVTLPTARQRKLEEAFYIPMGNNGHVGFPISLDAKVLAHKYASFKVHAGTELFLKHDGMFRMKTDFKQNGFMKLATGQAREKLGFKFDVDGGMCFHTESKEFGLAVAYRYEHQRATTLTPFDTLNFDKAEVNSDDMLQKWDRHAIVVRVFHSPQWDNKDHDALCPHFNFSFTQPLKGKRILRTNVFGGAVGLDFSWNF